MNEYVIYKDQALLDRQIPATHAIIIGVGEYAYLHGGSSNRKTRLHGGLQQLSSPPASAKIFAKWLLDEFNNPDKPLATLSLLISDKDGPFTFNHGKLPAPVEVKKPTIDNVKRAIRDWKAFGDINEENLVLFFFCGHGVAKGLEGLSLLLTDYGEFDDMPMDGAVDFAAMHRGMAQCKASEQVYFIDACRVVSDIATKTTAAGLAIIQDNENRPFDSDWNYAIYYSTLGGEAAYGRRNKPSYFTEELINGLNGMGSNNRNPDNKWRVSTGDLSTAIHRGLSLRGDKIKVPMAHQVYFEFHEPKNDPIALAIVNCDPKDDNKLATLLCKQGDNELHSRPPAEEDWALVVPYGTYDFIAKIAGREGAKPDSTILPPYQEIKIQVQP